MGHTNTVVTPELVYASKDGYRRFKEQVDEYLRAAGSSQVKLASSLGMHSTGLNRKLQGERPLDHDHVRSIVTFLVERGGITGLTQLEELLRPLGLNLTLFSPAQWDSPPLAAIATVVEYAGDSEGSRAGDQGKEKTGPATRTTRSSGGKDRPGAGGSRPANSPGSLGKRVALSGSGSGAGSGPNSMVAPLPRPARPNPAPLHNLPAPTSAFIGRVRDRQLIRNALVGVPTGYGSGATLPGEETLASPLATGEWAGTGTSIGSDVTGIGAGPGAWEGQAPLPALSTLDGAPLRLLTLTGPGGVGKTRLALELAGELVGYFRDGVYFVDLSDSRTTAAVVDKLSRVLEVKESAKEPPVDSLKARLSGREMLLVLDNFEQVLEAAVLVGELLASSNGLKIVVTSRECLHLYSEYEYAVPLLTIPDLARFGGGRGGVGSVAGAGSAGGKVGLAGGAGAGSSNSIISNALQEELGRYEAVALFVQRARRFKPQFSLTPDTGPVVAEICVKLEGLALAVELAACRVKYMPVGEILSRLTDRFGLLKAQMQDKPGRHHTLRATIDWSYDLLRPGEKKLLRRLSVFRGGATLSALEAVCSGEGIAPGTVVDLVGSLVDKSFVRLVDSPVGVGAGAAGGSSAGGDSNTGEVVLEPRYMLLETIREYAWERLLSAGKGEAGRVRERHADYYLALAEEGEPKLVTGEQLVWRKRLDSEYDNIRAALEWFIGESEAEKAGRLAGALGQYWYMAGYFSEGRRWLEQVRELFDRSVEGEVLKAKTLYQLARLIYEQGDWRQTEILLKNLLKIWSSVVGVIGLRGQARTLSLLGNIYFQTGKYEDARQVNEDAANLCRQMQEFYGLSVILSNLGAIALRQNDLDRAVEIFNESIEIQRENNIEIGLPDNLVGLAIVYFEKLDYKQARLLLIESLKICQKYPQSLTLIKTLLRLGLVTTFLEDFASAKLYYKQALELVSSLGSYYVLRGWFDSFALITKSYRDYIHTIIFCSIAEANNQTSNVWVVESDKELHQQLVNDTRQSLDQATFEQAWTEGQALAQEDESTAGPKIVELALAALSDNSQQGVS